MAGDDVNPARGCVMRGRGAPFDRHRGRDKGSTLDTQGAVSVIMVMATVVTVDHPPDADAGHGGPPPVGDGWGHGHGVPKPTPINAALDAAATTKGVVVGSTAAQG